MRHGGRKVMRLASSLALMTVTSLLVGCVSTRSAHQAASAFDETHTRAQSPRAEFSPVADVPVFPIKYPYKLSLEEALTRIRLAKQHADIPGINAAFKEGDEIWFFCMDGISTERWLSPTKGLVVVRARNVIYQLVLEESVAVDDPSKTHCGA